MTAIYQRARPARFDQVVGQDHVTSLLVAALRRDAIGHAYLFSGPRGVGKTTSARLLAMAVNCDAPAEERPCGRCASCRAVQTGSHPDVIELDAASNNSVEDVRELREQVRLAPLRGGRRVWILDEAHMLSRAAANALLKTLEEPPPGLLFVLATTEPEKLPPTVLSRCQHFRFRRLSDDEIHGKLTRLVAEAERPAEDEALMLLARSADGAMRDAESMLERLLASGGAITRQAAESALGLPPFDRMAHLVKALADADLGLVLSAAAELYADGFAPRTLAEQVGRTLRGALVARLGVARAEVAVDLEVDDDAIVRALHVLDDAHERFVRRGDLYALEVTLIRVVTAMRAAPVEHAPLHATATATPAPPASAPPRAAAERAEPERSEPAEAAPRRSEPRDVASRMAADAPPAEPPRDAQPDVARTATTATSASKGFDPNARPERAKRAGASPGGARALSWHALLTQAGPQLKAFLLPAEATLDEDRLTVRFDERHAFHFGQLQRREDALVALLDAAGGSHLALQVEGPGGRIQRAPRTAEAPSPGRTPDPVEAATPAATTSDPPPKPPKKA